MVLNPVVRDTFPRPRFVDPTSGRVPTVSRRDVVCVPVIVVLYCLAAWWIIRTANGMV